MNPRQEFLTTLFAALDGGGVRYCVLRNYENLYTTTDTDVDLLVAESSRLQFERCLDEAAARTGFRLAQAARYVNYSRVYWHAEAGFVTIDFETEIRWRRFRVLDANQLLDARIRHQEFFVPAPADEAIVILTAALWRNHLSERYRRRLGELFAACESKADLLRTLAGPFGRAGETAFDSLSRATTAEFNAAFWQQLRRAIILKTIFSPARLSALARNCVSDAARFWTRLRRPAGISLLFASANRVPIDFSELNRRIERLFPAAKGGGGTIDLGQAGNSSNQARVLFKGGMFIHSCRVAQDADLSRAMRAHSRTRHPARAFLCAEDSAGRIYLTHTGTGFMKEIQPPKETAASVFAETFVRFAVDALARQAADQRPARRGAFGVLLGLDGAGKTTLARRLCCMLANEPRFTGVRYFHWRPHARRRIELPLPAFADQPRKKELPRSPMNSFLSAARLLKNALLARVAYHWRVRSQVQSGRLVLVDRYFYNYHLDPASVKFSGPDWLLKMFLPLFPKPDFVITLDAPPEILLGRKRELSEPEIRRQSAVLKSLKFGSMPVIAADAAKPADEVASQSLQALL